MIPIALVTCREHPLLCQDDQLLIAPLSKNGFEVSPQMWDDEKVDWTKYRGLIIRSTWDYQRNVNKFQTWLKKLEMLGVAVFNPIDIISWNIDKILYLQDLQKKNIQIIPSVFLTQNSKIKLREIMDKNNWEKAIVKPRYGAGSERIFLAEPKSVSEKEKIFNEMLKGDGVIVQKFIEEIEDGEYSFIFINRKYSHAVLKKPKKGEYRINYSYGGKWTNVKVSDAFINQANRVVEKVESTLLYARVDMFNINGKLLLNELELAEPFLFFNWHKESAVTFANTFAKILNSQ